MLQIDILVYSIQHNTHTYIYIWILIIKLASYIPSCDECGDDDDRVITKSRTRGPFSRAGIT